MLVLVDGIGEWINVPYARSVAAWAVAVGLGVIVVSMVLRLIGFRVIGARLEPEVALEWVRRWVSLTKLERWTILWGYTGMDEEERAIFRELWIRLDCRVFSEFNSLQNVLLSIFGGGWIIGEMARSIPHQEWMTGIPIPSPMPIQERPTTFVQILSADIAGRVFFLGMTLFFVGLMGIMLLR